MAFLKEFNLTLSDLSGSHGCILSEWWVNFKLYHSANCGRQDAFTQIKIQIIMVGKGCITVNLYGNISGLL